MLALSFSPSRLPPSASICLQQKDHYSQKNHCNDNCNDFSDYNDIIAPLDKLTMLHYHLVLRGSIMLHSCTSHDGHYQSCHSRLSWRSTSRPIQRSHLWGRRSGLAWLGDQQIIKLCRKFLMGKAQHSRTDQQEQCWKMFNTKTNK